MNVRVIILLIIIAVLAGCTPQTKSNTETTDFLNVTDAAGRQVAVPIQPQRVVALSSSLADIWLEAGGTLVGVSSDAIDEQALPLDENTQVVGTIKEPSADILLALQPDLVILSPDIAGHTQLAPIMDQAGIAYYYATADTFEDYLAVLQTFTALTGKTENYNLYGTTQQDQINEYLTNCQLPEAPPTALVLRAFSSGVKAKADGIIPTEILDDFGIVNIAARQQSLLEDLSLEVILEENPDYVFVVFMGDDAEQITANLKTSLTGSPAWATLDAVQNGQFYILPKDLFHFKPNGQWKEAYAYLYDILCAP